MPGMNGTGPMGQGPMTGRGMGLCNPNAGARRGTGLGYGFGRGLGRGFGRGFGRGLGFGRVGGFYPYDYSAVYPNDYRAMDYAMDRNFLEQRQSILEAELKNIKENLASLSQESQE